MRLELRCEKTLSTAVDAADTDEQAARFGSIRPPLEDFAN
jgi:hypothetical protein